MSTLQSPGPVVLIIASATLLSACGMFQRAPAPAPAPAPVVSVIELSSRPAERALLAGLRAYDDAQYPQAEEQLRLALKTGLASPHDQAAAQKYLAFIYCTTQRQSLCEAAFLAARQADPAFALSKGEAGHPLWGPVYKRVIGGGGK